MALNASIELLAPYTCGIAGWTPDRKSVNPAGTAFFVAPRIALTAKHVVMNLWDTLVPEWEKGRYPTRPTATDHFHASLYQIPDATRPDRQAVWNISRVTLYRYTDAAALTVIAGNEVAREYVWPGALELELLPPPIGAEVSSVGFPGTKTRLRSEAFTFDLDTNLIVDDGTVVEHYESRGIGRFPQFETTAEFPHGLSGGAVLHGGRICGIVSYATSYGGGSFAAALWPMLLQEKPPGVDPVTTSLPLVELLATDVIRATGWRAIRARASVQHEFGREPLARLDAV